jgi:hypothetical protein
MSGEWPDLADLSREELEAEIGALRRALGRHVSLEWLAVPPPPPEGQGWCDQCERLFPVDQLDSHSGFLSLCSNCRARPSEKV